ARGDQAALDRGYARFCKLFEDEMIGIHGIDKSDAHKYRGRAKGMKTKIYPAVSVSGGAYPVSSAKGRAWRKWSIHIQELSYLVRKGVPLDRPDARSVFLHVLQGPAALRADPFWQECAVSETDLFCLDFCGLVQLCAKAKRNAERLEKQFHSDRGKAWRSWVQASLGNGAGLAHKFTKVPLGWVPSNPKGGPPKGPMGRIDDLMEEWARIWSPKPSMKDLPDPISLLTEKISESSEEPMVLATSDQIRKCSRKFKARTAIGADRTHPRDFEILSDGALECVAALWFWMESLGKLPEVLATILIAMIPKDEEASVLVDMTKCYEKVVHFFLALAAIKHGFPLYRLRYLLCLYRGQRVLQVGRVCSELVACIQAILAGCTFATTLLKCLLLDPLDQVVSKFPSVRIYNVVDDITCGATGKARAVARTAADATFTLRSNLEKLGFLISPTKGLIT
ncbi:unnamed protein product, partial [Prorocentrum cordatum]